MLILHTDNSVSLCLFPFFFNNPKSFILHF